MNIRKAKKEEAPTLAMLIMLAMEDIIYQFIGEENAAKAIQFMEQLIGLEGNQYSYQNCWVAIEDNVITTAALVYDGALLQQLRAPVAQLIKLQFNRDFNLEDETQAGEFYIDCLAVNPQFQGKGFGSKMLHFLIEEYTTRQQGVLGLLVAKENPRAKSLYLKLGFVVIRDQQLAGNSMEHLQLGK